MATDRKSAKKSARRVLADSANAKHRFGFAGEPGSVIGGRTPKLSDMFYVEFKLVIDDKEVHSNFREYTSALAKSVSPISIQTSSMPVDQYGKRIYVPTRVDFPEVTITMYDSINGGTMHLANMMYRRHFLNGAPENQVTGANTEEVITRNQGYGRDFGPQFSESGINDFDDNARYAYYHQNFERITVYHFFGNLDKTDNSTNGGQGSLHKIDIINPLVTGITFSGSDYSATELRTVDFTIQPENIIIYEVEEDVSFPKWMTEGLDYMLDELSPLRKRKDLSFYPTEQEARERFAGTEEEIARKEAIIDEQNDRDTERKLNELMQLYNAQIQNPNEQGNEALAAALKSQIGTLDAARANKFNKTGNDDFNARDESTYKSVYLNPDVPTFGGVGSSNPPNTKFIPYSPNLGDAMVQELVSSTFGNRSFNANNVFDLKNQMRGIAENINSSMTSNLTLDGQRVLESAINANNGAFQTMTQAINPATNTDRKVINTGNHTGVSKQIVNRKLFD